MREDTIDDDVPIHDTTPANEGGKTNKAALEENSKVAAAASDESLKIAHDMGNQTTVNELSLDSVASNTSETPGQSSAATGPTGAILPGKGFTFNPPPSKTSSSGFLSSASTAAAPNAGITFRSSIAKPPPTAAVGFSIESKAIAALVGPPSGASAHGDLNTDGANEPGLHLLGSSTSSLSGNGAVHQMPARCSRRTQSENFTPCRSERF